MPKLRTFWFADPGNQKRLSELLNDPCMSMAIAVVREQARPTGGQVDAAVLLQVNALENSRVYGNHESLDRLEALTTPPVKRERVDYDPHTSQAKEALRAAGLEPPDLNN